MSDIFKGKACGVCHGTVAFPPDQCFRCHNGPRRQAENWGCFRVGPKRRSGLVPGVDRRGALGLFLRSFCCAGTCARPPPSHSLPIVRPPRFYSLAIHPGA